MARCERKQETQAPPRRSPSEQQPKQPQQPQQTHDDQICFLSSEAGDCRNTEARWYYNSKEGLCEIFAYGGCGGNQNNFVSEEECDQRCGNVQDPCSLPSVYGRCQENLTRWWYDQRIDDCAEFEFSGCRGNRNNFYTENECRSSCQRRQPPAERTSPPEENIDEVRFCKISYTYKNYSRQISNMKKYFYFLFTIINSALVNNVQVI